VNTFLDRQLEVTITLGTGTFGADVGDTVTLSGFRMFADMSAPCGETMGTLQMRIYGLSESLMNQLTDIGPIVQVKEKNKIQLAAGDKTNGLAVIFTGTIFSAWADYNSAPEVPFNIIANIGLDIALTPVTPTSYVMAADVVQIMSKMASEAGLQFNNSGINGLTLRNPYFDKDLYTQIKNCAIAANINYKIESGTLTIWPKNGYVAGLKPLISADTGMVGYPSLSSQGMSVKTLFNRDIAIGGLVEVQSSLKPATGDFVVYMYTHNLSCIVPGGPWYTNFDCYPMVK
jgi:hypothetical protein